MGNTTSLKGERLSVYNYV